MHTTRFHNKYLRNKTDENERKYTKQRNYCVSLLRKSKREYYSNLDVKNITDNKVFWKTVKLFQSNKVTSTQRITLIENDKIVKNDNDTARVFNTFFSIVKNDNGTARVFNLSFQILFVILRFLVIIIAIHWQKTLRNPF